MAVLSDLIAGRNHMNTISIIICCKICYNPIGQSVGELKLYCDFEKVVYICVAILRSFEKLILRHVF